MADIDYRKIPTEDLVALKKGDYSKVSTATLEYLKGGGGDYPDAEKAAPAANVPAGPQPGFFTGVKRGLATVAGGIGQRLGIYDQADIDAALSAMREEASRSGFAGKAGQFVGEALPFAAIPGGAAPSLTVRMLQSGAQGAGVGFLQPTATGESPATNALTGGVFGAAGQGVVSAGGKVVNAALGRTEKSSVAALADKYKVRTTLGEDLKNPIIQKSETWLEGVPLVGIKGFRKKQQDEASQAAKTYLSTYLADPAAEFGSAEAMSANRKFASNLFENVKGIIKGIDKQEIKPTETKAVAKDFLDRYPDIFKKFQDTKREALLQDIVSSTADRTKYTGTWGATKVTTPKTLTYEEAWTLRSGMGEMVGQARKKLAAGEIDETTFGQMKRLYAAVNSDLERWGASIGRKDIKEAVQTANDAYKQYVVKYDILDRALATMRKDELQGKLFSPQKFANTLANVANKNKYTQKFSKDEIAEMTGIAHVMHVVKRAGQYGENPPTGARWGPLAIFGGIEGAASGIGYLTGGTTGAVAGGLGMVGGAFSTAAVGTFLTTTQTGKALAIAASKVKSDSPAMQRIINQIYTQMPKAAAVGGIQAVAPGGGAEYINPEGGSEPWKPEPKAVRTPEPARNQKKEWGDQED